MAALTATGGDQAAQIARLQAELAAALGDLSRERTQHVASRDALSGEVVRQVLDAQILRLECRALVAQRDATRESLVRQLLDRRRAVRVVRLVNRVRLPFYRGDADMADVQDEVLRLARQGM